MTTRAPARLRVVTYNVHRCRGMDRRVRPERVAAVLESLDADVLALQEVIGEGPHGAGHATALSSHVGMTAYMAPARYLRDHLFGNLTLTSLPVVEHKQHDLTWKWREPRCCQRLVVDVRGRRVQVFNVHLGTSLLERRAQGHALAAFVRTHLADGPTIVLGDLNEWVRGPATHLLQEFLVGADLKLFAPRRRSYPGVLPLLHLDHIYCSPEIRVEHVRLHKTRRTLMASDHLPLSADLLIP